MDSLLEAAAQVLESEGFEKMTTTKVALRAGASVGSLYQYYPSKDALLHALFERKTERLRARFAASLAATEGQGLEARVRALIETLFLEKATRSRLGVELARQAPRLEKERLIERLSEDIHRAVHAVLDAHADEVGVADRELAGWLVVHGVVGIADAAMLGPPARLRDPVFISAVTEHVLDALRVARLPSAR